jgi:coniferyl-aldehyde dehydrogenase
VTDEKMIELMEERLRDQKNAAKGAGYEQAEVRRGRLQRAIDMLVDHEADLCAALNTDFGHRSRTASRLADILPSIRALKYARDNVESWMGDDQRALAEPYPKLGATALVRFYPKGVIGNIVPWNAPINILFCPVAGQLAAGNRIMVKPSEGAPAAADLLASIVPDYFDPAEFSVFTGGVAVSKAFAGLPFDHLLFTGSAEVGKQVMATAARNLVPVTLELGGKCPAIVGRSADLSQATDRIFNGKMLNAGQVCLSPDYVFVPKESQQAIVELFQHHAKACYPDYESNTDCTAVISDAHRGRIDAMVDDAEAQGATVVALSNDGRRPDRKSIKRPLTLILDPHDQMKVMQDEIFGPILPLVPYDRIDEVLAFVNERPRPLGLYYFGQDGEEEAIVRDRTLSGGMTVNDVIFHVAHEQLPFGGVGESGMGAYHGLDGFKTFSHARSIFRQTDMDLATMAGSRPPYGEKLANMLEAAIAK